MECEGLGAFGVKPFAARWMIGLLVLAAATRIAAHFWPFGVLVVAWFLAGVPVGATIWAAGRRWGLANWAARSSISAIVLIPFMMLVGLGVTAPFGFVLALVLAGLDADWRFPLGFSAIAVASGTAVAAIVSPSMLTESRECRGLIRWSMIGGGLVGVVAAVDGFIGNGYLAVRSEDAIGMAGTTWVAGQSLVTSMGIVIWGQRLFLAKDSHLCRRCEYDLTGNASGACPECGTPVGAGGEE